MIRPAVANILTLVVTALLLTGVGTVAADKASAAGGDFNFNSCPKGKAYAGSKRAPLAVGFVSDPYKIRTYQRAMGRKNRVGFYSNFEAWGRYRDPHAYFAAARSNRVLPYVTWEPWANVADPAQQAAVQVPFSNAQLAAGVQDAYIRAWARAVKANRNPVYLRLAHEMNSTSYPWSVDPAAYVRAWRHVVDIFRAEGARNARFVWSVNANTYQTQDQWCIGWQQYYPGSTYVDIVGISTIQFGGAKAGRYAVRSFARRIDLLRRLGKPIHLAETNSAFRERARWFRDLAAYLHKAPWVEAMIVSQAPSRATMRDGVTGNLSWDLRKDKTTRKVLQQIMRDRPLLGRKKSKRH